MFFAAHRRNYEFGARLQAAAGVAQPPPPPPPPPPRELAVVVKDVEGGSSSSSSMGGIFDRFRCQDAPPPVQQQEHVVVAPPVVTAPPPIVCSAPPQRIRELHRHHRRPWESQTSPQHRHSRAVSGYRKRYVAASQAWKCGGRCGQLLPASFEVDHIVRLDRGGDNSVTNLVALCRNCHGHKTFVEML